MTPVRIGTGDAPTDSPAGRVERAWLKATRALGYAITTKELTTHWATYGIGRVPRPLSNNVQQLLRSGHLHCVVDRPGRSRYVHRDFLTALHEPPAGQHFEADVLHALRYASTTLQRFVTTREVTAAMLTLKLVPSLTLDQRTKAWQILAALARPVRSRTGDRRLLPGPVTMAETFHPNTDGAKPKRICWWRPADLTFPPPPPDMPATKREAAQRAVEATRACLTRPPNTDEVALYLAARRTTHPNDPVAMTLGSRGLGPALQASRGWIDRSTERGRAGIPDSGLRVVRTPFTAGRLLPPRLTMATPTAADLQRAAAEDLLFRLQPARELALLGMVEDQRHIAGSPQLDIVALRRWLIHRELLAVGTIADWWELLPHLQHVIDSLHSWLDCLEGKLRYTCMPRRIRNTIGPRRDDLHALETMLRWPDPPMPARFADLAPISIIGDTSTSSIADLAPVLTGLVAMSVSPPQALPTLRSVRRVPAPAGVAPTRSTPQSTEVLQEQLDRVDAFAKAVDRGAAPRTRELVADAVGLLGTLLRDHRVVARALKECRPSDGWVIQSLLVGSGLLGIVPDCPPANWTSDTVEAALLGTILPDPAAAEATVRRIRHQIAPGAQWAARTALIQAECGEWLGLVG